MYTIDDIKELISDECTVSGRLDARFNNVRTLSDCDENSMIWLKAGLKNLSDIIRTTKAKVIICPLSVEIPSSKKKDKLFVQTENPKLLFIRIVTKLFQPGVKPGIHPKAIIHENAVIGTNVYIGPNAVIEECTIGDNCVIHGNTYLFSKTVIGNRVVINPGTVIGTDGFGYGQTTTGSVEKFPHLGGVDIGDDVEIGCNTAIDKGTLGNTIIEEGVKIDNLVHIAHNVRIGKNTLVIANSMIGGSTVIGANSWVAPSVAILNGLVVGESVTIGMGAVVTKSIPAGEVWAGLPAKPLKDFVEQNNKLKKL